MPLRRSIRPLMDKNLFELENSIGYEFNDKKLLKRALTHTSYVNENRQEDLVSNERLEFFGDAVIEFFVSEYLFDKYEDLPEGDLTRIRASMVCEQSLAKCAMLIDLGRFLFMGRGEEATGGRIRPSVTSDAFEALTASVYLDGGLGSVKSFIYKNLINNLKDEELFFDAKTRLQELSQKLYGTNPEYELIKEKGPSHDKIFEVCVYLNGEKAGEGKGHSKKAAEQEAAKEAMKGLSA